MSSSCMFSEFMNRARKKQKKKLTENKAPQKFCIKIYFVCTAYNYIFIYLHHKIWFKCVILRRDLYRCLVFFLFFLHSWIFMSWLVFNKFVNFLINTICYDNCECIRFNFFFFSVGFVLHLIEKKKKKKTINNLNKIDRSKQMIFINCLSLFSIKMIFILISSPFHSHAHMQSDLFLRTICKWNG